MASYQELLDTFFRTVPGAQEILNRPEGGDFFNRWTSDIMKELGVGTWEEIPAAELATFEYAGPDLGQSKPAEQALFDAVSPGLVNQIAGDEARAADVTRLTDQATTDFSNLRNTLGLANVTVGADGQLNSPLLTSQLATVDNARNLEIEAASAAAKTQLDALNESIAATQANLQGALGQQAAELQKTITALSSNLDTLNAAQKSALAEQVRQQQANLERSIAEQQAALAQESESLRGNASAAAVARRAALEQQLSTLRAAQGPLNDARLRAAEGLATAVNIGLERTKDDIAARLAADGYNAGGSSMTDAALARATVDARQNAAQALGSARVANAADERAIEGYGAGQRYSIEDVLTGNIQGVSDEEARRRSGLISAGATGRQGIGDYSAEQERGLASTDATNRANLGMWGASTAYDTATRGIADNLNILNAGTQGRYDITTALAGQTQDATNRAITGGVNARNDAYSNAVNAGQILTSLPGAEAQAKTALLPYGTAGTRDAMNTFNWFSSGATPPDGTMVLTTPDQSGNAWANLGANLVGGAFRMADGWKPPGSVKVPKPTVTNASSSNVRTNIPALP